MKNKWMVIGSLFLASAASADFSGNWQGSGTFSGQGTNLQCPSASISLTQTVTALDVGKEIFQCQGATFSQDPFSMTIQNGMDLFFQGQNVGMVMDDSIDAHYVGNGGSWTWHVTKSGNQMNYTETAIGSDGSSWTITGVFKRQ